LQKLCGGNDSDVSMNVEYRNGGVEYVSLMNTDKIAVCLFLCHFNYFLFLQTPLTTDAIDFSEHGDIGRALIERGVALAEFMRRNDPRLKDLVCFCFVQFVFSIYFIGYCISKCTSESET
jgi:hypothetical protein